jgi:hypothetical protein
VGQFDELAARLKDMMSRPFTPEEMEAGRQWRAKAQAETKPWGGSKIFFGYDWGSRPQSPDGAGRVEPSPAAEQPPRE